MNRKENVPEVSAKELRQMIEQSGEGEILSISIVWDDAPEAERTDDVTKEDGREAEDDGR